ncbi:MAG: hypothetical protein GF365_01020 [Candidatus Buchananbacteria bacterium]|nr:hypothetical protein [Candidatus Buchananbacteria bacterium]
MEIGTPAPGNQSSKDLMPQQHEAKKLSREQRQALILELLASGDPEKEKLLKDYWQALAEFKQDANEEIEKEGKREAFSLNADKEDAEEWIEKLVSSGIKPILSLPKANWQEVQQQGLKAKATWIPELKVLAATLGVVPYKAGEEDRVFLQIEAKPRDLQPRITGKDRTFHGVVGFNRDYIPPDKIEQIDF